MHESEFKSATWLRSAPDSSKGAARGLACRSELLGRLTILITARSPLIYESLSDAEGEPARTPSTVSGDKFERNQRDRAQEQAANDKSVNVRVSRERKARPRQLQLIVAKNSRLARTTFAGSTSPLLRDDSASFGAQPSH